MQSAATPLTHDAEDGPDWRVIAGAFTATLLAIDTDIAQTVAQ
ncbi:hypothetical protein [Falsiroseomonas sp. HW251]